MDACCAILLVLILVAICLVARRMWQQQKAKLSPYTGPVPAQCKATFKTEAQQKQCAQVVEQCVQPFMGADGKPLDPKSITPELVKGVVKSCPRAITEMDPDATAKAVSDLAKSTGHPSCFSDKAKEASGQMFDLSQDVLSELPGLISWSKRVVGAFPSCPNSNTGSSRTTSMVGFR